MRPKPIALTAMGILMIFVVGFTMAWQVIPVLAGFTPTPEVPTATPLVPTATPIPATGTPNPMTSTAVPPTQPSAEDTPEMPVTGGQISGSSDRGIGVVLFSGLMVLLLVTISLVSRRAVQNKNGNIGGN